VDQGSFKSGFFSLVGGSREDPYYGQPRKWHIIVVNKCCIIKKDGESMEVGDVRLLVSYGMLFSVILGCFG
jgi:hypothetical protein